jgi:hypothetical protein
MARIDIAPEVIARIVSEPHLVLIILPTSAFKGTSIASVGAPSMGLVPSLGLPNTMTRRGFSVSPFLLAAAA